DPFEQTMHDREQFFRQRRPAQCGRLVIPFYETTQFFIEEIQREILLGPKIVEQRSLGDPRPLRNRFGGGAMKSLPGEQLKRRLQDGAAGLFLVLATFADARSSAPDRWASLGFHFNK